MGSSAGIGSTPTVRLRAEKLPVCLRNCGGEGLHDYFAGGRRLERVLGPRLACGTWAPASEPCERHMSGLATRLTCGVGGLHLGEKKILQTLSQGQSRGLEARRACRGTESLRRWLPPACSCGPHDSLGRGEPCRRPIVLCGVQVGQDHATEEVLPVLCRRAGAGETVTLDVETKRRDCSADGEMLREGKRLEAKGKRQKAGPSASLAGAPVEAAETAAVRRCGGQGFPKHIPASESALFLQAWQAHGDATPAFSCAFFSSPSFCLLPRQHMLRSISTAATRGRTRVVIALYPLFLSRGAR